MQSRLSVPRSQLIGKKVYKPDGGFVGEVADTGYVLGSGSSTLIIKTSQDSAIEIPWENVAAAKDILILAESTDLSKAKQLQLGQEQTTAQLQAAAAEKSRFSAPVGRILGKGGGGGQAPTCPTCGKAATWIKEYSRWYCYQDKKYL